MEEAREGVAEDITAEVAAEGDLPAEEKDRKMEKREENLKEERRERAVEEDAGAYADTATATWAGADQGTRKEEMAEHRTEKKEGKCPKKEAEEEAAVAVDSVAVSAADAVTVEVSVATDSAALAEEVVDAVTAEVSVADAAKVAEDTAVTEEDTVADAEKDAVVVDAELLVEAPAEAATADHLPERRLQLTKILKYYNYNYNNKKHLSNFKQEEILLLNVCKKKQLC